MTAHFRGSSVLSRIRRNPPRKPPHTRTYGPRAPENQPPRPAADKIRRKNDENPPQKRRKSAANNKVSPKNDENQPPRPAADKISPKNDENPPPTTKSAPKMTKISRQDQPRTHTHTHTYQPPRSAISACLRNSFSQARGGVSIGQGPGFKRSWGTPESVARPIGGRTRGIYLTLFQAQQSLDKVPIWLGLCVSYLLFGLLR